MGKAQYPKVCREHFNRETGGPGCMDVATRANGLCERHHFEAFKRRTKDRLARGVCRDCGKVPVNRWANQSRCALCRHNRGLKRKARNRASPKRKARIEARNRRDFDRRNLGSIPYPAALMAVPMGSQRREFVTVYALTGNAEQSAKSAGFGSKSAERGGRAAAVRAHKLLRDPRIRAAVADQKRIFETPTPTRLIVREGNGRFLPNACAVPGVNTERVPLIRNFR